jgi:hypothetical protein
LKFLKQHVLNYWKCDYYLFWKGIQSVHEQFTLTGNIVESGIKHHNPIPNPEICDEKRDGL